MRSQKRVMFYVQHLLGIGHVRRASLLAEAMACTGLEVHMVLGGVAVEGMGFAGCHIHRLPEARAADSSFSALIDHSGNVVDEAWKNARCEQLCELLETINPDLVLVELFPFGRRQFRFELLPLLERVRAAPNPPHVACSVRDILMSKNDVKKNRQTVETINTYFDSVFIHGDKDFYSFDQTFPHAGDITCELVYTGYVCPLENVDQSRAGHNEVIVAAGGGAVGETLMIIAAHAKPLCALDDLTWRFLTGPNLPDSTVETLLALKDPGIVVEPNRGDYSALLRNCRLSISQGGYNTLMDIVQAGCSAVIVPFGTGAEDEQRVRSRLLERAGYVTIVEEKSLRPEGMAEGIGRVSTKAPPQSVPFSRDGAKRTAELVRDRSNRRQ